MPKGTGTHQSRKGQVNPKSDVDVGIGIPESILTSAKLLASAETGHFTSDALKWVTRARAVAIAFMALAGPSDLKLLDAVGGSKQTAPVDQDHLTGDAGKKVIAMREADEDGISPNNPRGDTDDDADFKIPE